MFENVAAEELLKAVRVHDFDPHDDPMNGDRIDAIKACELVVRAAQAMQAQQIAALDTSRASQITLGHGDHSLSVIGELGMARNVSPSAAGNHYGFAIGLARMPHAGAVFAAGGISEQAARLVVRESTGLDREQVTRLDTLLDGLLAGLTPRKAGDLARHYAIGIDVDAAFERAKANRSDRFVSYFPDTDGIAVLQVRGPAEQLLAAYNALDKAAKAAKAKGDPRTTGQVMCDEFVQRVTGLNRATDVSIEIGLVMTMGNLLDIDDNPVALPGFGPIPAALARRIICSGGQAWIRRLFTDPVDHSLTDCDQRRRRFEGTLAKIITRRDARCRQPGRGATAEWRVAAVEDSPIRHLDHILAFSSTALNSGGPTILANGQGLCGRSHRIKHLPGWKITAEGSQIDWTTPTGHTYRSKRPALIEYRSRGPGHLRQ